MKPLTLAIFGALTLSSSLFSSSLGEKIQDSSLLVYNGGVGLVHEKRSLSLTKNDSFILYEDVANTIETDSVNVKLPDSVTLYSQQYRFDKLTQLKLLNAHVGREVEVKTLKDAKNFEIVSATLLSASSQKCVVKTSDSKIVTVDADAIIFNSIPKELITKPSLVWNVKASRDVDAAVELDYLIRGVSWKSDYILNVLKDRANLSGWISVDNRSGKKFEDTTLSVLAGDVNMAQRAPVYKNARRDMVMAQAAPVEQISHEGYHLYRVPLKINVANNEKTQIKFMDERDIKIRRSYIANLSNPLYLHGQRKHDVTQYVNLAPMNVALPKGVVRTYSKVDKQSVLLGQTNVKHTPKKSPIELKIGTNFDLKVTQTLLSRQDSKYQLNSNVEYLVKNSSDDIKTVELLISFNASKDSKIKTHLAFKRKKGNLISFNVDVAPNSSKKFEVNFVSKR